MSPIEFNQHLRDAGIVGVAYGVAYCRSLKRPIPSFSLIARNEKPLRQAYEEFARWAESSDADAVDLTFLFQKKGGYRLIVSPEPTALMDRLLRFDAVHTPLTFQISWIKQVDSTAKELLELSEHLGKGIRPFLLSAALYTGPIDRNAIDPSQLAAIENLPELLKFKVRFVHEGSDENTDWQQLGGDLRQSKGAVDKGNPRGVPPPAILARSREDRLKTLFPVTLWRARHHSRFQEAIDAAAALGIARWQVDQAICNLCMSRELCSGALHFESIEANAWPKALLHRLRERFELADASVNHFDEISIESVIEQVRLDGLTLLNLYGIKPTGVELTSILDSMRKSGFLVSPA